MSRVVVVSVGLQVDNLRQFEAALKVLAQHEVEAGIPDTKAERRNNKNEPMNNATLAYIHDNGSPAANIPARPFMREGIADVQDQISQHLLNAGDRVLEGKSPMGELNAAGLTAQNGIRARINSNIPPPLAKSTLAARKRRGRTGERALVDTAQMRNAITYVVRKLVG